MTEDHDRDELLKILEAHGNQFLSSFSSSVHIEKKRKQQDTSDRNGKTKLSKLDQNEEEYEDWSGFGTGQGSDSSNSGEGGDDDDLDISDDDFAVDSLTHVPNVVVFADPMLKSTTVLADRSQMKAFMSSKVSKLRQDTTSSSTSKVMKKEDGEDDFTNAQNDALLHRLVHTKLLSGSLNPDLNLSGAQRRKALEGRALELAGKTSLGKGESVVRQDEMNRAAKRVRLGIEAKQKERAKNELEAAKNLGNYHPALKKIYGSSSDTKEIGRKRVRGLKMGVGRFQGGVLKLSREEIRTVEGTSSSRGGKSKGARKGKR